MTLRERIETVFNGGRPDKMVWFGDLTYWHSSHRIIGDLPDSWSGPRGIGQMHKDLNIGEYVPGFCAYSEEEGCEFQSVSEGDMLIKSWRSPLGQLHSRQEWSHTSFSHGYLEHPVKTASDLKILRDIMRRRIYRPDPEAYLRIDNDYGQYGLPVAAIMGSPLAELNKWWAGIMDLCYLIADAPAEIDKTMAVLAERQDEAYRITAESECRYVMLCENLSGATMGSFFDRYIKDYLSRRIEYLHQHGKKVMIHIDGTLRGALDKMPSIGVDCIDAVTPKPVGDLGVEELRSLAGEDILILGGMPGAMFAPPYNARHIEKHVRDIIRIHKDSGKFMFGVADQVPPDGDLSLVRLVSDLIEEYGTY